MNPNLLRRISEEFERIERAVSSNQQIELDALYPDLQGEDRQTALAETRELLDELRQSQGIVSPWISAASMSARYEPVEPVNQGGMGEIWVALDQDFNRQVAIKEILPDAANDPRIRQRFLRESQITAKLEHPGILPVYSKGTHADGRPFYAMRWVSGEGSQTLHHAMNALHSEENLSAQNRPVQLHDLLHRFVSVCQTVAFAHHANVVHRDLKPANILLGPFGETFVVDWGLAIDLSDSENTFLDGLPQKTQGEFFGTPGFSAPECLEDPHLANPRCDIFSLGMILYHLCAGASPFTKSQKSTPQGLKIAMAQGAMLRLRQIDPSIHPALEAICDKATAFHPEDRYATAKDLAADISKYLGNEPTLAWPEPWTYRSKRWLQRRIATIVTLAVATMLLLGGALGYAWISYRHNMELSRKSTQLEDSLRAEAQYKLHALEAADLAKDREKLANDAIETFWSQIAQDPRLRFSEEFRDLKLSLLARPIEYYRTLSESYQNASRKSPVAMASYIDSRLELSKLQLEAGDWDDARSTIEQVLQDTESILLSNAEIDDSWLYRKAIATKTLVRIYSNLGDQANASKMNEAFEEMESKLASRKDLTPEFEVVLAEHAVETARALSQQGQYDKALARVAGAFERTEALCERFPDDASYWVLKEEILNDSALMDLRRGEIEQAQEKFRQLLKVHELRGTRAEGASASTLSKRLDPEVYNQQYRLGGVEFNLGVVAQRMGKFQESLDHHRRALEIREALAIRLPSVSEFQNTLGHSYLARSNLLMQRNQVAEGVDSYRKWVQVIRLLYARQQESLPRKMELVSSLHQLGHFEQMIGNTEVAMGVYTEALPLAIEVKDARPEDSVWLRHRCELSEHLGTLYFEQERWKEAGEQYDQAIDGQEHFAMIADGTAKERATYRMILRKMMELAERFEDSQKFEALKRKRSALDVIDQHP